MAVIHKLITGGNQWLEFAKSKLQALVNIGLENASQHFAMHDGSAVQVRIAADQHFIRIDGGYRYEFFTSEHVIWNSMASPGYEGSPSTVADNFIAGSLVSVKGKTPKPVYSAVFTPGPADTWVARAATSPISRTDPSSNWASWQNQKCFEFSWWRGQSTVTSSQAQAPGLLSTCNWQSAHTSCQIGNRDHLMTDVGLDVPPSAYKEKGSTVGAPSFVESWVWWRRAVVVAADNGRKFFVMADNYGRFHVYPFKDYAPSYLAATYQTYTPPYPAWVTVPSVASEKVANQWNWQFSKDGTRCVCLPYHSEAGAFYKYGSSYVGTILPEEVSELLYPGLAHLCREDTPGLVEFGISITSGDSENDYTATFTPLRSDYFNTSGRYIFDAGYAMAGSWATEDALITAEIECFTPPGGYAASSTDGTCTFTDTFESLRADMVFYANDDGLGKTELHRIPVVEGRWGRFLTIDGYRLSLTPGNSSYLPSGSGVSLPLAAGGSRVFNSLWPSSFHTHSSVGSKLGVLYASDVRNGSLIYEIDDYIDGTAQVVGRAFDKEFYNLTDALGFTEANPRGAATVKVPIAGRRVYLYALAASISTAWGVGFNVHPKGHWSCQIAGADMGNLVALRQAFDIVQPKGGRRTTHKALFNQAFRQTRDYSFYTEAFSEKQLVDPGSFRTFGIWR